jgi:hypothetical protein
MNSRARFETSHVSVSVAGLAPEHQGLTIAHLTDLHVGIHTPEERLRGAVQAANDLEPDLVVLTGDYVTWSKRPVAHLARVLGGLRSPVFCVLGNHDHIVDAASVRQQLERAGYTVLQNEHREVTLRGCSVHVVGIDDQKTRHADVPRAFAGVPTLGTRIVLTHVPTTSELLPPNQNLVCFAGHTHGGQIHFGSLTTRIAKQAGHRYLAGLHAVKGNHLYVGRGLAYGKGSLLPRRKCPPELALIELKAA